MSGSPLPSQILDKPPMNHGTNSLECGVQGEKTTTDDSVPITRGALMCWSISTSILRHKVGQPKRLSPKPGKAENFKKFRKVHIRNRIPSIISVSEIKSPFSEPLVAVVVQPPTAIKPNEPWLKDSPTTMAVKKPSIVEAIKAPTHEPTPKFKSTLFGRLNKFI